MKKFLLILSLFIYANSIEIKQMPLNFTQKRIDLTKEYIKNSYGLDVENIYIVPKVIVIHHTAMDDLKEFGVDSDAPDLFSSETENLTSEDLLSSNAEDEEDDLEIPAFLRRQKN